MKKRLSIKKFICIFLTLFMVFSCLTFTSNNGKSNENLVQAATYNISDKYLYELGGSQNVSPDSIEVWVNVTSGSTTGGTILGNYYNKYYGYPGAVNVEVTTAGKIMLRWNCRGLKHTFSTAAAINDGAWRHIAIVRDAENDSFSLYYNGILQETVYSVQPDSPCSLPLLVGADYSNWGYTRSPLDGQVRQVTLYKGAITPNRVAEDRLNNNVSTDDVNATLIGNWYFGETWTNSIVDNSKEGGGNARIVSYEKYVTCNADVFDTSKYDYMLVCIPDIQIMVRYRHNALKTMFTWLKNNAATYKMKFAIQVGDLSDNGAATWQYQKAYDSMSILDGYLPYSFIQGNHDYDNNVSTGRESTLFNTYFPTSKYADVTQNPTFGGLFEEGTMANSYNLLPIDYDEDGTVDVKYLILNLEFGPRRNVIRWANKIAEQYPDHRIILNTHALVDPNGAIMDKTSRYSATNYGFSSNVESTTGKELFEGFMKKHPNMFMAFSGHNSCDDLKVNYSKGEYGNTITSHLVDVQSTHYTTISETMFDSNGNVVTGNAYYGEDIVCLMCFNETDKTVRYCYYSVKYNKCFNVQNQFIASFADEFNPTVGA